ncbi:MAG: NRDE family protein, partial [Planctomycetota bacterium]|nr:NRDE family protein [Planctomycetota bacterium]
MCTLTLVRTPNAPQRFRAIFSRDELRSRSPASPPRLHSSGSHACLWPLDPDRGGTWLGINDSGLLACVLNRNESAQPPQPSPCSRGTLPQLLLTLTRASLAPALLTELDASTFGPCTLICADAFATLIFRNIGQRFTQTTHHEPTLMLTSSGLGDALVEEPRRRLWNQLTQHHRSAHAAQLPFHTHRWPDAPHLSVLMERADAQTTSI